MDPIGTLMLEERGLHQNPRLTARVVKVIILPPPHPTPTHTLHTGVWRGDRTQDPRLIPWPVDLGQLVNSSWFCLVVIMDEYLRLTSPFSRFPIPARRNESSSSLAMNLSPTRKLDHESEHKRSAVHENFSSMRQLQRQQQQQQEFWGGPRELVDDDEWNAIQSAFDAIPNCATAAARSSIRPSSMVPSIVLPSSPPPPPPLSLFRSRSPAIQRFHLDAFCPGHSPENLKQHREFQCRSGDGLKSGNGSQSPSPSASRRVYSSDEHELRPWKIGRGLLPCQFPTRKGCLCGGGRGTTRVQCESECSEFNSSENTAAAEERAESDSHPLESQEQMFCPPELVVGGPRTSREEPFSAQLSELVASTAEDGSRESSQKQSIRRLPAWVEPAGRYLLASVAKSRAVGQSRDVSGLAAVMNSEIVKEEQILRPNAEQLGDVASAPLETANGRPAWVQSEQPLIGLPWGLQPSSFVDVIKPKHPSMQFRGQIVYSKTESEVNAATDELWRRVRELQEATRDAVPMGFDLEWKATFEKGEIPRKVAVLQLCLDWRRCDVIQIIHSGIPASLQDLLEAPSTLKVGLGIDRDVIKLRQDYKISTRKITDLSTMANKKMSNGRQWSLSTLALELTGKQVDKIKSIRCGNWEALPLSEPQLQYAATDAFASLHIYQVLSSFPNPESDHVGSDNFKSKPVPPTPQITEQKG